MTSRSVDLGAEERREGAIGADDVVLQVHRDDRGAGGIDGGHGRPLIAGSVGGGQAWARMEEPMLSMSRSAVNGLDRKTLTMSTPASIISWVFSRSSSGLPYRHQ